MRSKLWILLALLGTCLSTPAQTDAELDRWEERVRRYLARGQWSRLISPAQKICKADPDDEEIAKALLMALRATGARESRADLIRSWQARAGADIDFWFIERIEFLMETGADDRALSLLSARVRNKPDYFFESLIGMIHSRHGRDKKSRNILESLVDRAKTEIVREPLQLVGLARAYLSYSHGGNPAEAALVEAKGRDETSVRVRELLAQVYEFRKERPTDMRREYLDLLKIRPSWPDYEVGLARAAQLRLGLAGREQKKAVARALAINPNHPDALFMRGVELLPGGTEKRAQESFERGLRFNPNHLPCLSGVATIAYLQGGEEKWCAARDAVLRRDPTYGRLFQIAADILNSRRRWSESLELMREGVATDSKDPRLWDDFARYCLYLGLEKEGLEALKKADALVKFGRVWRNNMHEVLRILDKNYVLIETPHFLIRVHKKNEVAFKQDLPGFLEHSFAEFEERYGCTPPQKILWEVFADHKSFSVRTMGLTGLGLLGVCFGPTVAMDGPSARPAGSYNWASTAHHELAHVFTLQLSRNRVPRWLTEGLSTHEETRRNKGWGRGMEILLHDALLTDSLFKVRGFDSAFAGPRIGFAYFQAGLMADLLMKKFGSKKVSQMLRLFGEDRSLDDAFGVALGVTPKEFDTSFVAHVKGHLGTMSRVPTLEADAVKATAKKVADGRATDRERIRLAWAFLRKGKSFDAGRVIEPLLKDGNDDVELILLKAARAVRAKRLDVALSNWNAARAAGSTDFEMLMGLAKHAEGEGRGGDALALYQAASKSHPFARVKGASPLLDVARLLEGEGRSAESVAALETFTAMSDKALGVRKRLLSYYRGKKNVRKVAEILSQIVWITPFDVGVRGQRAQSFVDQGLSTEAVAEFEVALSLSDEKTEGNLRKELGRLLSTLDRFDDAVYHLERAVTLDGEDIEAQELLRQAEEKLKLPLRS